MGPYAVSETLQSFLLEHLPLFTPHFYPWSCTIHYAHLSRWCREVVRWEKTKWGGPCASYCMSRSSLAKGQHTASHPHMADFLEDLDSLFLKTSTPQAIAWDTCLAASTRPSKAALKMKNCALSSESTASLQVLKTRRQANLWDSAGNSWWLFLCTPYWDFSSQQTGKLTAQRYMKHIALTFKISCSCFKTAWTSSCNSHLNSSSYIRERQQQKH